MITPEFKSNLAKYISGLIAQKRALGHKYESQTKIFIHFDLFCAEQFPDEHTVTKPMIDVWALKKVHEHPGTLRGRVTPVSHLAQYMCNLGHEAYVFPTNSLPDEKKYIPHIYTEDELQRLFRQIDCCHYSPEVPYRHLIMPVLFRILYCCGLRLGEALRLKSDDVNIDDGVLLIRESKYDNDRYVPMSNELSAYCREYAEQVHQPTPHEYFFPAPDEGMIPGINIYTNFRRFLHKAGISHGGKGKGPRIYDFRHTFAVHCLKKFVLDGSDMRHYQQILKTYMGHSFFKYTAYYLRLTKDMYPDIRKKIDDCFGDMIPCLGGDSVE